MNKINGYSISNLNQYNLSFSLDTIDKQLLFDKKVLDNEYKFLDNTELLNTPKWITMCYSNQYFYLVFKYEDEKEMCYLVSQDKVYSIQIRVHKDFYVNEYILWGELIKDTNKNYVFLIEDIYQCKDKPIQFMERYNHLVELLNEKYQQDYEYETFQLQIKRYTDYSNFRRFVKLYIPQINYDINAILFRNPETNEFHYVPYSKTIQINSSSIHKYYSIIKQNKPNEEKPLLNLSNQYTFSMKVIAGDVIKLYYQDKFVDTLYVPTLSLSHQIQEYCKTNTTIKCKYDNDKKKWIWIQ